MSAEGLEKAIQIVEDLKNKLEPAMEQLINQLTAMGVQFARGEIMRFEDPPYYTGELYESIESTPYEDGVGSVVANCLYAIYVEYGTGLYTSGGYESNRGEEGWFYFNERDGKFHWTDGMQPRPFMLNAFNRLRNEADMRGGQIIAEYLAKNLG